MLTATNVAIFSGGVMTLPAAFTDTGMSNRVCVVCTNFTLAAGGAINADALGCGDLYAQAQGVLHPDWQSFTGFLWYKTEATLTGRQASGPVRVMFPGLFSEAWLYVNGWLIAHRPQKHIWSCSQRGKPGR